MCGFLRADRVRHDRGAVLISTSPSQLSWAHKGCAGEKGRIAEGFGCRMPDAWAVGEHLTDCRAEVGKRMRGVLSWLTVILFEQP